ncbi:MAG: hypothetical protein WD512_13170 [Candidatus Paceibacterota bacterium]
MNAKEKYILDFNQIITNSKKQGEKFLVASDLKMPDGDWESKDSTSRRRALKVVLEYLGLEARAATFVLSKEELDNYNFGHRTLLIKLND